MKFRFRADIVFEAEDKDDAIRKLVDHFIYMQDGAASGCEPIPFGGNFVIEEYKEGK